MNEEQLLIYNELVSKYNFKDEQAPQNIIRYNKI